MRVGRGVIVSAAADDFDDRAAFDLLDDEEVELYQRLDAELDDKAIQDALEHWGFEPTGKLPPMCNSQEEHHNSLEKHLSITITETLST